MKFILITSDTRSTWRLYFVRWHVLYVFPQCGSSFTTLFCHLEFLSGFQVCERNFSTLISVMHKYYVCTSQRTQCTSTVNTSRGMLYNSVFQTVGRGNRQVLRGYSKGSPNSHSFATVLALGADAYFPVPQDF